MSVLRALAGRWLDLPPARYRAETSPEWVAMSDGTRLATTLFRPATNEQRSVVLMRTISPLASVRWRPTLLARLLAEQGHVVALQECRGLHASEGDFTPFHHEGEDGATTLDWLTQQPGCDGPVALAGFGYAGHAAWATLARSKRPVAGLIVGFAARDPFAWLHGGGAFELSYGFDLALSLAAGEAEGVRTLDRDRALRFRPVREADRVASRRIDWLRDWIDHPVRDEFWRSRAAPLPEHSPHALLIGGWHHPSLSPLIADHAALDEIASEQGTPRPRLLIGPWAATPLPRRSRPKGTRLAREVARSTVDLLDRACGDTRRPAAPVRAFVSGRGWLESGEWPPETQERVFYLNGCGRSGGALATAPPGADTPADVYVYDPADEPDSGSDDERGDVLRYASEPESGNLELAGPLSVELFASSSAPRTDFAARLVRVAADGESTPLSEGIVRTELAAGATSPVTIELEPHWVRLEPGDHLRLDVSSCGFPRFDRHPNGPTRAEAATDADGHPARQAIHHDADNPSRLRLRVRRH